MLESITQNRVVTFATFATVAASFGTFLACKRLAESWRRRREDFTVLKLVIYPIKSLGGFEVDQLEVTKTGVKYRGVHDRSFVLLNEHNRTVTLSSKPQLSLLSVRIEKFGEEKNIICVSAPANRRMPELRIPYDEDEPSMANEMINFKILKQDIQGIRCAEEADAWFSAFLDSPTKLVRFNFANQPLFRASDIHTDDNRLIRDPDQPIVFQDECAISLMNQASIDELNRRLANQDRARYRQFRANVLIRAEPAFCEDAWDRTRRILVGDGVRGVSLVLAKPCHRCTTTLVDDRLGAKNARFEPLATLRTFRVEERYKAIYQNSPILGLSLSLDGAPGMIEIGDSIRSETI